MKSDMILGPYFVHCDATSIDSMVPLGFGLEWATPEHSRAIPLFYQKDLQRQNPLRLDGIVFPANQLPFSLECPSHEIIHVRQGHFLPVESLLVALYHRFDVRRSICKVLSELLSFVPLHSVEIKSPLAAGLLLEQAEKRGFRLTRLFQCDDAVIGEITWKAPNDETQFHVASCGFRPGDSTGSWIKRRVIGVGQLLFKELCRIVNGPPSALLSSAGEVFLETGILVTRPRQADNRKPEDISSRAAPKGNT